MKKNSITTKSPQRTETIRKAGPVTIGMDLGDKTSCYCALVDGGEMISEQRVTTSRKGMRQAFGAMRHCRIAVEVGGHSPWVSRLLKTLGHEVIVANARQVNSSAPVAGKTTRWMHGFWRGSTRSY